MKSIQPFHLNDWDDFEVCHNETEMSDAQNEYESYERFCEIVEQLPKSELIKRGWIKSIDDLKSMVPLFQNIHSKKMGGLFRKSNTSNDALCSVWQTRISELAKVFKYTKNISKFEGIDKRYLKNLAQNSPDVNIVKRLPEILSEKGIILVYEKTLPGMKLDGVVFRIESGNPVIGISFRFPRIDNFWFTLMHELAHIVLHYDVLDNPIFDDLEDDNQDIIEIKANRLAKQSFVDRAVWRNCPAKYSRDEKVVLEFASKVNIHPAVIAGMLQKETNTYNIYRKIVDKVDIRKEVFGNG